MISINNLILFMTYAYQYACHGFQSGAIIGNDEIILGVSETGSLNVRYEAVAAFSLPAIDPTGLNRIGLRSRHNEFFNSVEGGGAIAEGWGVRVHNVYAGSSYYYHGANGYNLNLISFSGTHGGSTATSIVEDTTSSFRVTHNFYPSPHSQYVFECDVTITNLLGIDSPSVKYRRVIDWDMWPTLFQEYISIWGTQTTPTLIHSNDNGFCSPDPNAACYPMMAGTTNIDFVDKGPRDHGAQFTLDFGLLAGDESLSFKIFFGVADGESKAITALASISSELYTISQQRYGATTGLPFTAFFAFSDVGGEDFTPCADCVSSCTDSQGALIAPGNYPSCNACNVFVSCTAGGVFIPNRPCPANLVWDGHKKACQYDSNCNFGLCSSDVDHTPIPCVGACVNDCAYIDNGDYKSCLADNVYASCVAGTLYDNRPCPGSLVWDDKKRICNYESSC